ncbi:roundabout homolog 1 isoform X2 [Ixodes scapularis]|uniref:roundabout homolog 1 isoform X2 n=1 Tax=Ixodes scapularis TaxID=6945 RepID=UPI001C3953CF|nr:roundabout homolog 1 isoform X2 [Ixodes scapularis]
MVLPEGQLFFLHVQHSRRDQDTGIYWCTATNQLGEARSRNASVELAVLREEFRATPKSSRVAAGESATLECVAPRGHPEPSVTWFKDGAQVATGTGRIRLLGHGSLLIADVRHADQGRYVCRAANLLGTRETPAATLSVHTKPYFVRVPEDVTTLADETVEFQCKVNGDPKPTVTWRRQDGKMPVGRANIQEDKSLRIQNVAPMDEGTYICESQNFVGSVSASASLTVHSRPSFRLTPEDQKVGLNGVAKFDCLATGNPLPSVFWTREGKQVLMFPGKSHGRFSVTNEGTLVISSVRKEDRGYYTCSALSVVGSSMAKGHLEVTANADLPPPVIRLGPANQTLPINTAAIMPCEASGKPTPTVRWQYNGVPLQIDTRPRYVILQSGTLRINGLQITDSGTYTCTASTESGETSWTASLTVESPHNPNVNFHRSPDPSTFPGPPSKPVVVNISETSITLTWRRSEKVGESSLKGYSIEYYSSDLQSGWVSGARRLLSETYTVQALRPDSRYIFIVRAENSHGLGPPSPASDTIRTLGLPPHLLPEYNLDEARAKLTACVVTLLDARAASSTAVKLTWRIQEDKDYVEGFYIRFRDVSGGSQKYNMVTVLNGAASSYVLSNLRPYTKYEFFLVPFFMSVEGPPSNSRSVQTLEDVPTAAPQDVTAQVLNVTTATIFWSPPPSQHCNGKLRGYNVYVTGNLSEPFLNKSTNSTTNTLLVTNLKAGASYKVRIVAHTSVGSGPLSSPVPFSMDSPSSPSLSTPFNSIVKQSWFIALIGCLMFIAVSVFVLFVVCKRKLELKKAITTAPVQKPEDLRTGLSHHDALWINQSAWRPCDSSKDAFCDTKLLNKMDCASNDLNYSSVYAPLNCGVSASDYAEVDTQNLTTFCKKDLPLIPEPYATTTLINPSLQKSFNGSAKDGRSGSSGEEGSRLSDKVFDLELRLPNKAEDITDRLLESDKLTSPVSDSGSYTTDEYGMPIKKSRQKFSKGKAMPNGPMINWAQIIPPPPEQPPSDAGSAPNTPASHRRVSSHSSQPKKKLPSGCSQASSSSARVLQGVPRFTGPSPWASLNESNSLGACYADPSTGPHFTTRGLGPLLSPPQQPQSQTHPSPFCQSLMNKGVQSSLPSLLSKSNSVSPALELSRPHLATLQVSWLKFMQSQLIQPKPSIEPGHVYHPADGESDAEEDMSRPRSLESSVAGDTDYAPSHAPSWSSMTEQSNSSCTSGRSSGASSYDDSVYNEIDFASAVALAAQNAGFQVTGSIVSTAPADTNSAKQGNKNNIPAWLISQQDGKVSSVQRPVSRTIGHQLRNTGDYPQTQLPLSLSLPMQRNQGEHEKTPKGDAKISTQNKAASMKQPNFHIYHEPPSLLPPSRGDPRWRAGEQEDLLHTKSVPMEHIDKGSAFVQKESMHMYHGST